MSLNLVQEGEIETRSAGGRCVEYGPSCVVGNIKRWWVGRREGMPQRTLLQ